jgi:hypothetical protein
MDPACEAKKISKIETFSEFSSLIFSGRSLKRMALSHTACWNESSYSAPACISSLFIMTQDKVFA